MAKKQTDSITTPSGNHTVTRAELDIVKQVLGGKKKKDPIQSKNEAISKEKAASVRKTGAASHSKLFETTSYQESELGPCEYISRAVKEFFQLTQVIFKENQSRWDFPKKINNTRQTHVVARLYPQVKLYVDLFNAKDPQDEIDRIKAHMEALGLQYTYVKGGDGYADQDGHITEAFKKLVFEDRLKPIDVKKLKNPLKVPKNLEEAGNRPLTVQA